LGRQKACLSGAKLFAQGHAKVFFNSRFPRVLDGTNFTEAALEVDRSVVFVLDADLRIVYCNQAWDVFARENNGYGNTRASVLGTSWIGVIPEPLKKFYADGVAEIHRSGMAWEHDFECSSPDSYRRLHMRVLPLPEFHLLFQSSQRVEKTQSQDLDADAENFTYVNQFGVVTMCAHCRRARRADPDQHKFWDFVPRLVRKSPDSVSHGLCPKCCAYFYGPESTDSLGDR
jgi:hypothetical protein